MQSQTQEQKTVNKKISDIDKSVGDKKGLSKGGKIIFGFISGCFVILIIMGVIAYLFLRSASERAGEEIERAMENTETSEWQEQWQEFSSQLEEEIEGISQDLEEKRGVVGDVLSDGSVSITLNSENKEDQIGSAAPREGYDFIIFDLDLLNQTNEEIIFYSSELHLRDSVYTEYNQAALGEESGYELLRTMQNVLPGKIISGKIVFEVKNDARNLELIYIGEKKLIFEINNN